MVMIGSVPALFLVFAVLGMAFAVCGNVAFYLIVLRVNERLPPSEQILVAYPGRALETIRRYRKMYPGGRLVRAMLAFAVGMGLCLIASLTLMFSPFFGP